MNKKRNVLKTGNKIIKICPDSPDADIISEAVRIIKNGGIVISPTKCLYGMCADAFNHDTVSSIYSIKRRPANKPLLLLIKNRQVLKSLATHVPPDAEKLMDRFWPGNLTIVFPAKDSLPENLTAGSGKIGVRIPGYAVTSALVNDLDHPITGTSANISGEPGCSLIADLSPQIAENVDLIFDAGPLKGGKGSTVVDVTTDPPEILREGEISEKEIFIVLSNR